MKKQIILAEEAKEQILEGAKLLYDAVSTTLGPKGQNAVIEAYGEPIVTHDGVTVAKAIEVESKDRPGVRVGVEMIKSSSSKTNDNVGDGTTSSTILAYHLIDEGMKLVKEGKNPMIIRRELEDAAEATLEELKHLAKPVKTEKDAIEVATISSENHIIGAAVGKMFYELGKDGLVAVDIGNKTETEYEIVEGYTFDRGMASPLMATDSRTMTATLKHPVIFITEKSVSLRDIFPLATALYNEGKDGMLVIAGEIKADILDRAVVMKEQGFDLVCVKAPGFGEQRPKLLNDIAKFTGGNVIKDFEKIQREDLGTIEKLVVSQHETVLTGGQKVDSYIKDLTAERDRLTSEFDKDKLDKRIAKLRAKVGQIRVGGNTEMEAEERKYLIDDAVAATEAALKEGIVPGGGTTYVHLANKMSAATTDGEKILKEALYTPFKVLMTNSGLRYGKLLDGLEDFGKGYDVLGSTDEPVLIDLKEHGIIDPVLVIKQAITNAVSVAGSALTTGVLITNEKEESNDKDD